MFSLFSTWSNYLDMVGVLRNKRPIVHDIKNDVDKYRLKFDLVDGRFANVFFITQNIFSNIITKIFSMLKAWCQSNHI